MIKHSYFGSITSELNRLLAFLPPLCLSVFSQLHGAKEGKTASEISVVFLEGAK